MLKKRICLKQVKKKKPQTNSISGFAFRTFRLLEISGTCSELVCSAVDSAALEASSLAPTDGHVTSDVLAPPAGEFCQVNQCRNGGTCMMGEGRRFICICPDGFNGETCNETESGKTRRDR